MNLFYPQLQSADLPPLGTSGIVWLLKSNPDIEMFHIWNQILAQSYTVCWSVCFFVEGETAVISEEQ
jgi:hypothetical protein